MADSKSMLDALQGALDTMLELELFAKALYDAAWQDGNGTPPSYLFPLERQIGRASEALVALEVLVRRATPLEPLQ
jgi:hypothetical protein